MNFAFVFVSHQFHKFTCNPMIRIRIYNIILYLNNKRMKGKNRKKNKKKNYIYRSV